MPGLLGAQPKTRCACFVEQPAWRADSGVASAHAGGLGPGAWHCAWQTRKALGTSVSQPGSAGWEGAGRDGAVALASPFLPWCTLGYAAS
jgi:hypothetical protein